MSDAQKCEYCGRPIKKDPTDKVLRGKKHTFCSEFCFRLFFFKIPGLTYDKLQEMYKVRCVSVPVPDFKELLKEG
jgi:hypothetical protein